MANYNLNYQSKEITGNTEIAANPNRRYFCIIMTGTAGTIEFGKGGGKIPLDVGEKFEPNVAPTGVINVEAAGAYVIVTNGA